MNKNCNKIEYVYYYTSSYVFEKWCKNETIRATRSITSNDKMDTKYIVEMLKKEKIVNFIDKLGIKIDIKDFESYVEGSKHINNRILKDIIYNAIKNWENGYGDKIKKSEENIQFMRGRFPDNKYSMYNSIMLPIISEGLKRLNEDKTTDEVCDIMNAFINIQPFVICFSKKGDNRFLWDSYTQNKGVCLKLDVNELNKIPIFPDLLHDVCYSENQLIKFIEDTHKTSRDIIKYYNENYDGNVDIKKILLCIFSGYCKHPYWADECEVRLLITENYSKEENNIKEFYGNKYNNNMQTQDYVEVKIPKSAVKEVIIGPLNNNEEIEKINKIAIENNINISESIGKGIISK